MLDASPARLVEIAAGLGLDAVSLFVHMPADARRHYPMVTRADVPELRARLDGTGLGVGTLEVFPLDSDDSPERFAKGLEIGAALGGRRATVHVHGCDGATAAARFGAFAELAGRYGISAALEFNAFSAVRSVEEAAAIVRAAGHPSGEVVLDCLHFGRSGGTADALRAAADLVRYVQLSDGPAQISAEARWREAIGERDAPGSGAFALLDWLGALGPDLLFDVEVPQAAARKAGVSAEARAGAAVAAARSLLAAAGRGTMAP